MRAPQSKQCRTTFLSISASGAKIIVTTPIRQATNSARPSQDNSGLVFGGDELPQKGQQNRGRRGTAGSAVGAGPASGGRGGGAAVTGCACGSDGGSGAPSTVRASVVGGKGTVGTWSFCRQFGQCVLLPASASGAVRI
jgi:hypothetical protein